MPVNPNWPLMATQVAFNSGFATTAPLTWTDLTPRMLSFSSGYGRQYELDQNQTGTASLVFLDKDEVLNPANPAPGYPFAGNILPYRPVMVQAQWPPVPVGGAVNLLNSGTQSQPYDGSFESYAAGAVPGWVSAVGGTSPVVAVTTPNSGTKDLGWSTTASTTVQGTSWSVPCIPGQQYTSSAYVRQSSASTQRISVDTVGVADSFNRTVAAGSWGTADSGQVWTGADPAWSVPSAGVARSTHAGTSAGVINTLSGTAGTADATATVKLIAGQKLTGSGAMFPSILLRQVDATNYYQLGLYYQASAGATGSVGVVIQKIVAGVNTGLYTNFTFDIYDGSEFFWLKAQVVGSTLRVKVWRDYIAEPAAWTATVTDATFTAGSIGVSSSRDAGITNVNPSVAWQNFSATGTVAGTSTAATGAYVRLTSTFTATQPTHIVQVATAGTAVAGTVLLDDVQHEPGAAANTATTSGPVIYGVHRGYVERWPSMWKYNGMYGYCQVTTVDAFAALAARKLHTAYRSAVLAKQPAYYWLLGEPQGATSFADSAGRSGPLLVKTDSQSGPAKKFAAGTATNIGGDPGGVGVQIAETSSASPPTPTATSVIQNGFPTANGFYWKVGTGFPFGVSNAMWLTRTRMTGNGDWFVAVRQQDPSAAALAEWFIAAQPSGYVEFAGGVDATNSYWVASANDIWDDGLPHLYVGTLFANATTWTCKLYIDGVLVNTGTGSTAGWAPPPYIQTQVQIGSIFYAGNTQPYPNLPGAVYAHFALWDRALSPAEATDLWNAGRGYPGETSGQRITRYLTGNYSGASAIDAGQSTMGADVLTENTAILAGSQAVATSENGNFWVDGPGTVTFTSRTRRYLSTTSKYTFGEQELPYEAGISYDYDMQLVYNDVTVNNAGGVNPNVGDQASQASYGPRSYSRSVNVQSDREAADAATWILYTHKDPRQRIARLTIKPSSNPALWPVALGVKIGDRVTVTRRTSAFVMSADYFVEKIGHNQAPGQWTVTLELSPAALWPTPWILDDPTYSILGQTTTLGY
jgi:hypothetical protein